MENRKEKPMFISKKAEQVDSDNKFDTSLAIPNNISVVEENKSDDESFSRDLDHETLLSIVGLKDVQ